MGQIKSLGEQVLNRIVLIAGVAGLLSTAAFAQTTPAPATTEAPEPSSTTAPSTTPETASGDPDKIICRTVKPVTGTRVSSARSRQKMCMTKREWEIQEQEARDALKVRDRGTCAPGACTG